MARLRTRTRPCRSRRPRRPARDAPPWDRSWSRVQAGSRELSLRSRLRPAPADAGLDELVDLPVEDRGWVRGLILGAQVLDHLVRMQHVGAHLVAPGTGGVGAQLGERGLLLGPLALQQPRLQYTHGGGLVLELGLL